MDEDRKNSFQLNNEQAVAYGTACSFSFQSLIKDPLIQ